MDRLNKIICCIVCICFAVLIIVGMVHRTRQDDEYRKFQVEEQKKLDEELEPLYARRYEIQKELDSNKSEIYKAASGYACVSLVCTDLDVSVYEKIYPLLKMNGYKATLCFSDLMKPDDYGCLSVSQIYELKDAGWHFAVIAFSGSDIAKLFDEVKSMGLDPDFVYFPNNDCTQSQFDIMKSKGIDTVVYYDKTVNSDDFFGIAAIGANDVNSESYLNNAAMISDAIVLTVGTYFDTDLYQDRNLDYLIEVINSLNYGDKNIVCDVNTAKSRMDAKNEFLRENLSELIAKRNEYESELAEIESKIDSLKRKYM